MRRITLVLWAFVLLGVAGIVVSCVFGSLDGGFSPRALVAWAVGGVTLVSAVLLLSRQQNGAS